LSCGLRELPEALPLSGLTKPLIEADEIVVRWAAIGPQESGGQLQSVRGSQRMQDERARRRVSDLMARLDLDPVIGEAPHDLSRLLLVSARENVVASTSWDDRRRVPELHRPLSRSSRRAFSTAPAGSAGRGIFQNPFGSLPEPR